MRSQPVVGWRLDLTALIPDTNQPLQAEMFGNIGDRTFFTVTGDDDGQRAWVVGVDGKQGSPLFAPVEIGGYRSAKCFVNGPERVVCLNSTEFNDTGDEVELWVIDSKSGSVISRGPTDLRAARVDPPLYGVSQVGDYLIAFQGDGSGWHGIGDHGERTWFVPGRGDAPQYVVQKSYFPGDPVSNLMAEQDDPKTVFSAQDGAIVTPEQLGWIEPVIGGFVVMDGQSPSAFHFYDEHGKKQGEYRPQDGESAEIASGNGQRVVVTLSKIGDDDATQLVFTATGDKIAEVKSHSLGDAIRFIGDYMYAGPDDTLNNIGVWTKFDLKTGKSVATCSGVPLTQTDYVGSDGTVVLGAVSTPGESDRVLVAVDTDTCTRLWELPNKRSRVWTVGSTLIQAVWETNEITSLVPPAK